MNKHKSKHKDRGPTFVGLRPMIEKGKRERVESSWKKHKNKKYEN